MIWLLPTDDQGVTHAYRDPSDLVADLPVEDRRAFLRSGRPTGAWTVCGRRVEGSWLVTAATEPDCVLCIVRPWP